MRKLLHRVYGVYFARRATRIQTAWIKKKCFRLLLIPTDNNANGGKSRWSMSRGACEDSRGAGPRVGEFSKERGERGRARALETDEASYYYQFACLRSLGLPLSSFHLGDTGGLFPPIYFSAPIRDPQPSLPLPLSPLEKTLSRNFVQWRENSCSAYIYHHMLPSIISIKSTGIEIDYGENINKHILCLLIFSPQSTSIY